MRWTVSIGAALGVLVGAQAFAKPYPIDQWAMRSVVSNVAISPNGKRLALLKIPTKDGNPVIEIYDAANLEKEPFRVDAKPMEIRSFSWLNDDHILFGARQAVRKIIEGFNQGIYEGRFGLLDLEKKTVKSFDNSGTVDIASPLVNEPYKILLAVPPPGGGKEGAFTELVRSFLPRDYYEYDLKAGTRKLIVQGKLSLGAYWFDPNGKLLMGRAQTSEEYIWYWRTEDGRWEEYYRMPRGESEFRPFIVQGIDETKPNHVYVIARNGRNTFGLWSYDVKKKRFDEALYARSDVDVAGVRFHSNRWAHPNKVVGVVYATDKTHVEWFDAEEGAINSQLASVIPYAHNVRVLNKSQDGRTLVIYNNGPRDPGTYYLLREGKLEVIGSRQPLFEGGALADVEYHTYKARDGLKIAAYVTFPKGEAPYPLVVMPHGGPFGRDGTGYDPWAQLLANYGYLVVQPQFRGSTGFGEALYRAAYADGGQQGTRMQDDKDDAALYLVRKKLADPDRLAMFGWSYGGYAAAVAASRTPQIYQCVVPGAAVFDPVMQLNYYRFRIPKTIRDRRVKLDELAVDPMEEVTKVNVPMLIIHGDVDQRVPVDHARKYTKLLDKHKVPYTYLELKGADHFSYTLFYNHRLEFFTAMINFLKNDCGPGGL